MKYIPEERAICGAGVTLLIKELGNGCVGMLVSEGDNNIGICFKGSQISDFIDDLHRNGMLEVAEAGEK